MGRISRAIIVTTPLGLFAMSAAAAGAMRVEEFLRLQVWFVVYIGAACLISLWLLPALVALLTPVPYGRFVRTLQTAMLTAFAAGDYFVVLPMIAEANKQLLTDLGKSEDEADQTIGVVVPLLFNFPHTGKILSLAFIPFGAWFSNVDMSIGQWFSLGTAGTLSMFGSINAAMPFLLDLVRLPVDLLISSRCPAFSTRASARWWRRCTRRRCRCWWQPACWACCASAPGVSSASA